MQASIAIAVQNRAHSHWEGQLTTPSGQLKWIQGNSRPQTTSDGLAWDGLLIDISDRKQAEAALRESEARFQAFMNNSPAASWITDADGRLLYLSETYLRMFQVPHNAIGKTIFEVFAPEIAEEFYRNIRQVADTHQMVEVIEPAPCADGTLGSFLVYKFPLYESSGQCFVGGTAVNITERERTKEKLRSLNDRLQYLLTHTPVVIFSCRAGGDYGATSISENIRTLFGYEPHDFLEDSSFWADHIHPEDRDRILANVSQVFATEQYTHEYRFLHQNGEYRWAYSQLQLMRDPSGNPTEIIGYLVDISDRKQTEAALRQSEATNRAIINAIPDFLFQLDRNGNYLHLINTNHVSGLCVGDVVPGVNIYDVLPFDKAQERMGYVERALETRELQIYDYEFAVEGEVYYEEARITPINEQEVLVMVRDITDRRRAEVEIELQSIIVRNMAEGVCMVKVRDGLFVYTNPKFERMFGYETDELIGQHVAIVNYEDKNTHTTAIYEKLAKVILAQGEAIYEVQNVRKDGTSFRCQATTSVFEHPNHGAVFVVVQQDITERKQAESMIQASLKEKEVLLKEIHHRVKNNLGVVDGLLQMQARRSPDPQVVETLKESQNRIASIALVHEKLYGSKDLANIDFAQYIADLTAHLFDSYNTRSSQIKLITQIDDIPLDIDTAIPCGLIINELVSNALKYAFPNAQGEIHVTFHQHEDQYISLIVQDNGIGLPPGFNLKQTKTLGMSLIQGLVKQIQGTLEISSDSGTTTILRFAKGK